MMISKLGNRRLRGNEICDNKCETYIDHIDNFYCHYHSIGR